MKKLPIGIGDFKNLIENNYYYVDKSLFIKKVAQSDALVTLLPRPRRFGKTLNLSMLKYFFEKTEPNNTHLFKELLIAKEKEIMAYQGKNPVIFLTFKDVKPKNWKVCYDQIKHIIIEEYKRHKYLLKSNILEKFEKDAFKKILDQTANEACYQRSLKTLATYLTNYHQRKPYILIDEYDEPIHSAYNKHNEFYENVISFMRGFLCGGLKDNDSNLEKGIVTGILRISKESIFSGMNNLKVYSILSSRYAEEFGFLEQEINTILDYFKLQNKKTEVRQWYNGYQFGDKKKIFTIYNPWSIINYIDEEEFKPYWINTSNNALIKEFVGKGNEEIKENLEYLIQNKTTPQQIREDIVLPSLYKNIDYVWSLLFFSGYLTLDTSEKKQSSKDQTTIYLKIPNKEITQFFKTIIIDWFKECITNKKYLAMLESLTKGNIETFSKIFSEFVFKSFSYFNANTNEPEKVYHSFVLGMLIGLTQTHRIKSEVETGMGRCDVIVIPKDKNKLGIIIEFKKAKKTELLEQAANEALKQIKKNQYVQELYNQEIKHTISLGIAFAGKEVFIKSNDSLP